MNHPVPLRSECVFALRLHANDAAPQALSGALEHVMSGRCHIFSTGAELLACLALETAGSNLTAPLQSDGVPPRTQPI